MRNIFTIGEMAKFHNVSIKTLRYYDEIDLLNPGFTDKNNNYRYYTTEQFEQLSTIKYLKELGFSLKDIKNHLSHSDTDSFINLLEAQMQLTEDKINQLTKMKQRFKNRINDIRDARSGYPDEVPFLKTVQERKIAKLPETIRSESELEFSIRRLEELSNMSGSVFIGGVGLTVSKENLLQNKFDEYNSVYINVEDENAETSLITSLPKAEYVCIKYNGNHAASSKYYRILFDFINQNQYKIAGDAIERTIINQFISQKDKDYLTELQIPITH